LELMNFKETKCLTKVRFESRLILVDVFSQ
jgi:hypothetical protein